MCVRTGDGGGDARGLCADDDLIPDVYAGPYVDLEPEMALVLDDGSRAVGYVLGTADTAGFVRAYREQWVPRLAARYPPPPAEPVTAHEHFLAAHHHPERMLLPELVAHPAHLHIDLLPEHQGAGHGRALITAFLALAARAGAPAVHLEVADANTRARAFYDRVGFTPIPVAGRRSSTFLGRATA